jgi:hypothetical protein
MDEDLVKEKGAVFLNWIYTEHEQFEISNGWLERFKVRYGICSFRRFGESRSVNMSTVVDKLPRLIEVLNRFGERYLQYGQIRANLSNGGGEGKNPYIFLPQQCIVGRKKSGDEALGRRKQNQRV